jgi:hypothetical protein
MLHPGIFEHDFSYTDSREPRITRRQRLVKSKRCGRKTHRWVVTWIVDGIEYTTRKEAKEALSV